MDGAPTEQAVRGVWTTVFVPDGFGVWLGPKPLGGPGHSAAGGPGPLAAAAQPRAACSGREGLVAGGGRALPPGDPHLGLRAGDADAGAGDVTSVAQPSGKGNDWEQQAAVAPLTPPPRGALPAVPQFPLPPEASSQPANPGGNDVRAEDAPPRVHHSVSFVDQSPADSVTTKPPYSCPEPGDDEPSALPRPNRGDEDEDEPMQFGDVDAMAAGIIESSAASLLLFVLDSESAVDFAIVREPILIHVKAEHRLKYIQKLETACEFRNSTWVKRAHVGRTRYYHRHVRGRGCDVAALRHLQLDVARLHADAHGSAHAERVGARLGHLRRIHGAH